MLSDSEIKRYSRQLLLPNFGIQTQQKLKDSSVLVVGAGGLGSPVLKYITSAGVGNIGIVDYDNVDQSNLQRQVLFFEGDVGKNKAIAARQNLEKLNSEINFKVFPEKITSENALEILKDFDVIVDGTDNFPTRYLINDACLLLGKPLIYGSIFQYEGQVSVFNYQNGPNYRDLFPSPPPPGMIPSCTEGGVLGATAGIIGSLQASEVLKIITGKGDALSGKLLLFDGLSMMFKKININKNPESPQITKLIDYEDFCGLKDDSKSRWELSPMEVKKLLDENKCSLVDIREKHEHNAGNIGGICIEPSNVIKSKEAIPKDKKVILYCKAGSRSMRALKDLQELGFNNLYNLKGGLEDWKNQVDHSIFIV